MNTDLHVVAMGARTPVGYSAQASAASARAGISRIRLQVGSNGDSDDPLSLDAGLGDMSLSGAERMVVLGQSALEEALHSLPASYRPATLEIPTLVGLPEGRPGWGPDEIAHVVAALTKVEAGALRVAPRPFASGHAALFPALAQAQTLLASGQSPVVIVGGIDSYIDGEALEWLSECGQWKSERVRAGLIPGEAAAFVVLTHARDAASLRMKPLARVRAHSTARETKVIKTDAVSVGEGLSAAVSEIVAAVGPDGIVHDVYCDINGERYRSEEWGFVALRLAASFRDATAYHTGASVWGDVGAASGPLNMIRCVQAWRRSYAKGDTAIIWGSSEGGLRGAALLSKISV